MEARNPYMKILDLTQLFVANAHMKKKNCFTFLRALLEHPIYKYFFYITKIFLNIFLNFVIFQREILGESSLEY